jgi:hypothetical protein
MVLEGRTDHRFHLSETSFGWAIENYILDCFMLGCFILNRLIVTHTGKRRYKIDQPLICGVS